MVAPEYSAAASYKEFSHDAEVTSNPPPTGHIAEALGETTILACLHKEKFPDETDKPEVDTITPCGETGCYAQRIQYADTGGSWINGTCKYQQ